MPLPSFIEELRPGFRGEILPGKILKEFTTIRVGGPAECLVHPTNIEDLKKIFQVARKNNIAITILGRGSNILISDEGISGIVIRLVAPEFSKITRLEGNRVKAGCGVLKSELLTWSVQENLAGLEFSAGIPGDIGGGLRMNAGTKYGCYADCLLEAEVFRPESSTVETVTNAAAQSQYRNQTYVRNGVVLSATFQLKSGQGDILSAEVRRMLAERKSTQPVQTANFGSTFKNPKVDPPRSAGKLIEEAGLKGTRIGGAEVSEKHANFILNRDNATAKEIRELMRLVQERVYAKFQVRLEPEIQFIGKQI